MSGSHRPPSTSGCAGSVRAVKLSAGVEWAVHCCVVLSQAAGTRPAARHAEFHGVSKTNHARHLLAVSSRVSKMKSAVGGDWDAMLFDVSTLSDVAHALADLDAKADGELRYWLRVGVGPLLQDTAAAVHGVGSTYYLRCRPEVAARRLAGRLGRGLTRKEADFLHRLAAAYDEVVPSTPGVVEIDGELDRHAVTAQILKSFQAQLDELRA